MQTDTILLCRRCKWTGYEDDLKDPRFCDRCGNPVDEVCRECLGTGEVTVHEPVYPNEPHTAPIGTRPCLCTVDDSDE